MFENLWSEILHKRLYSVILALNILYKHLFCFFYDKNFLSTGHLLEDSINKIKLNLLKEIVGFDWTTYCKAWHSNLIADYN